VRKALQQSELPARLHPTHVNRGGRGLWKPSELTQAGCTIDVTAFYQRRRRPLCCSRDHLLCRKGLSPDQRPATPKRRGRCLPVVTSTRAAAHQHGRWAGPRRCSRPCARCWRMVFPLERALTPFTPRTLAALLKFARKGRIARGLDACSSSTDHAPAASAGARPSSRARREGRARPHQPNL
jgi:hypothetical protein